MANIKKERIPFVIFVNTESVGSRGYMSWDELKEISKFDFVHIGNHSHTHEYLVDMNDDEIRNDLITAKKLLDEKLNNKTKLLPILLVNIKIHIKESSKKWVLIMDLGNILE